MERNVYLTAIEPGSGKSAVALGVMEALASLGRVGYFRPIVAGGAEPDNDIELIRRWYRLPQTYQESFGAVVDDLSAMSDRGRYDELLKRILDAYKRLDDATDLLLVEGSDFSEASHALEFDFNADMANHLGCPVLLVVRGSDRSVERVLEVMQLAHGSITGRGCTILATICNRVSPELVDELRERVHEVVGDEPAYVMPEVPELAAPTVAEVAHALAAEFLRPVRGAEEPSTRREVGHVIVGAMSLPHFLEHISDNDMIITPGDRADLIVGSLASRFSGTYPNIAGLVLTGGLVPEPSVLRLIDGLGGAEVPVLATGADTYQTAATVSGVRGVLTPESERKIAAALGVFSAHVDRQGLLSRLEVTRTERVTPLMFEQRLVERAKADRRHIVLPEGGDDRVLQAAEQVLLRGIADLTVLGDPDAIKQPGRRPRPGAGRPPGGRPAAVGVAPGLRRHLLRAAPPQGRGPAGGRGPDRRRLLLRHHDGLQGPGPRDGVGGGPHHRPHHPAGLRVHPHRARHLDRVQRVPDAADRPGADLRRLRGGPQPQRRAAGRHRGRLGGHGRPVRHRAAGRPALLLDRRVGRGQRRREGPRRPPRSPGSAGPTS